MRSVAGTRSYHWLYRNDLTPANVAEFLILRAEMPRSLVFCLAEAEAHLDNLARLHGRRAEYHRLVGALHGRLRYGRIEEIFETGLHEYLTDFIERNNRLGTEIIRCYLV